MRFGRVLEARCCFEMHFDVIAGVGDVPNDAPERKAAQIAMPEAREVAGMHVDPRRSNVALPSVEN
jgi:hypothetical protein